MNKISNDILLRNYIESDTLCLAAIYFNTIHTINIKDYTEEQVNAWAPKTTLELDGWKKKWIKICPIVAVLDKENVIVGFTELEDKGHIDCFYVHHDYQGRGVGSAMMQEVERRATMLRLPKVYAEVSITAKPFFFAKGFMVVKEQAVIIRGITLTNYIMEKEL
jgi:putative acetyltransferase